MHHYTISENVMKTANLIGLLAVAALSSCSRPQSVAPPVPKVTIAHPQLATVTNWDEYPAHIQAKDMVEVKARVFGHLKSIHFEDGAEVQAGQLLFVIDPRPYQAELEHARADQQKAEADQARALAECQSAESRLELAANDLRRAEALRGSKAISEEELDSRAKGASAAQAALAAARAAIGSARAAAEAAHAAETNALLNMEYSSVKAPIGGQIGRHLVSVGDLIQGSAFMATLLTTIVSVDPVNAYFDTDERSFLRYRGDGAPGGPGPSVKTLACELAVGNETGYPHKGQIDFFDNHVDEKTGTIRVRGVFSNSDRALVPGLFARVRIPAGPPVQALLIPEVAMGSDQGQKLVMVVNAAGVVEPRPIKVDRQHGAMRAVLEGLTPDDRIVVNGLIMARPGSKVQITNDDAPAAPATGAVR